MKTRIFNRNQNWFPSHGLSVWISLFGMFNSCNIYCEMRKKKRHSKKRFASNEFYWMHYRSHCMRIFPDWAYTHNRFRCENWDLKSETDEKSKTPTQFIFFRLRSYCVAETATHSMKMKYFHSKNIISGCSIFFLQWKPILYRCNICSLSISVFLHFLLFLSLPTSLTPI